MGKKKAKGSAARKQGSELDWIAADLRPLAVAIGDLKLDPRNARSHSEQNLLAIERSLREFGQLKPIVVHRESKTVEAGNGLLTAARRLGWSHLAVVWVEHDGTAQRGFSIADNRTAELADWDDAILGDLIGQLEGDAPDLFQDLLLADLLTEDKGSAAGADSEDSAGEKVDSGNAEETEEPVPERFSIVIDCQDEAEQKTLFEQLQNEGKQCRLLTL